MKKRSVSVSVLSLCASLVAGVAAIAGENADVAARGARLFADASLGTNGRSCASCHADLSAWAGKARFPKVGLGAGVRTLDQAIQTCISNALAGKPLAWDDERLTSLAVYVDAAYGPKP